MGTSSFWAITAFVWAYPGKCLQEVKLGRKIEPVNSVSPSDKKYGYTFSPASDDDLIIHARELSDDRR
jgi:hypothetical protein